MGRERKQTCHRIPPNGKGGGGSGFEWVPCDCPCYAVNAHKGKKVRLRGAKNGRKSHCWMEGHCRFPVLDGLKDDGTPEGTP